MPNPVVFDHSDDNNEASNSLIAEKDALSKKLRQAFVVAAAGTVTLLSAQNMLVPEKDPKTNLEKPGIALTIREVVEDKLAEKQKNSDSSRQRLERIYGRMAQTENGRDILQYIKDKNVQVHFYDMTIKEHQEAVKEVSGTYAPSTNTILLSPLRPDDRIMITLAHEARHAWQTHEINDDALEGNTISPEKKILVRRYVEADAFAYQTFFALDYEAKTGRRLNLGRDLEEDNDYMATNAEMRDRLRKDLIDGVPQKQARLNVLKLGFETLKDRGYDKNRVERLNWEVSNNLVMTSSSIIGPTDVSYEKKLDLSSEILAKRRQEPNWNEMARELRKFGNMGFGKNDANYLDSVADKDIVSLDWMGGLSHVRAPQLKAIQSKFMQTIRQSEDILCTAPPEDLAEKAKPLPAKPVKVPGTNITL